MRKYIIILISTLFLFSCNSQNEKLHKDAQKVTDIIIESHDNLDTKIILENEFLDSFFEKYPPPLLSGNDKIDNENEELIHLLDYLKTISNLYVNATENLNEQKAIEYQDKYSELLNRLNEDHNINIHE
ncbi:hypothetical protein [Metabacillus fastidiosus]|uniref:hypothetical protein n=1 Tax=Metabacillus fastidiosus TaxID=1458 RepID=UPI003D277B08